MIICNYFVFFLTLATFVSITNLSPAPILQSKILSVVVLIGTSQEVPPSLKVVFNMSLHNRRGSRCVTRRHVSFQGTGFRIYDPIQELVSVDGEIWSQQKIASHPFLGVCFDGDRRVKPETFPNESINQSINQSNKSTKMRRASNCYLSKKSSS